MFNKKQCKNCKKKISDKYEFCPYCGNSSRKQYMGEDWGMLGEEDQAQDTEDFFMSPLMGISEKIMGKMFNSAMKMFEKELSKANSQPPRESRQKTNIRLMINGKEVNLNNLENPLIIKQTKIKPESIPQPNLSLEKIKKMSQLPKQEPTTNIRRLSNRIIYELDMPTVKSIEDISLIKLENSIEIKALAKDKVYFKLIPMNFPIRKYGLTKGKLILELEDKN